MAIKQNILVTGAAGYWGARTAAQLALQPELHVIALDQELPKVELNAAQLIQADLRSRKLADLLKAESVDAVCHLAFEETFPPLENADDFNLTGAIRVVEACAQAEVHQVVLMSSTAVYGARPGNPAFLREDRPLLGSHMSGWVRDLVEIESFCSGFRRQSPKLSQCILRFAHIVGPTADTPMNHFLARSWSPHLLGFDPMMQIIHEDDVVNALVHAVQTQASGLYNVAAEDSLPLKKLIALSGRRTAPVFHRFAYWSARHRQAWAARGEHFLPLEPDYLRYPCVGDLTKMREEFKFSPHYRADETLRQFAGARETHQEQAHSSPGLEGDYDGRPEP